MTCLNDCPTWKCHLAS